MKLKTIGIILLIVSISGWAKVTNRDLDYLGTKYVKVVKRIPIYDTVYESTPYEDCWDERVEVYDDDDYYYDSRPNPGAAILGSVVGGLIGHRVGRRGGNAHQRRAATIGGAIIGGIVGSKISSSHRRHGHYRKHYDTKRVCETRYHQDNRRRVLTGYEHIAYYRGHKIVKFSTRKLRRIPVEVIIDY